MRFEEAAKKLGLDMPSMDMNDEEILALKPLFDSILSVATPTLSSNKEKNTFWSDKIMYTACGDGMTETVTRLNLIACDEYISGNVAPPKAAAPFWDELIKSEEYSYLKSTPPPPESAMLDSPLMLSVREYHVRKGESIEGKPRSSFFTANEILACFQRYYALSRFQAGKNILDFATAYATAAAKPGPKGKVVLQEIKVGVDEFIGLYNAAHPDEPIIPGFALIIGKDVKLIGTIPNAIPKLFQSVQSNEPRTHIQSHYKNKDGAKVAMDVRVARNKIAIGKFDPRRGLLDCDIRDYEKLQVVGGKKHAPQYKISVTLAGVKQQLAPSKENLFMLLRSGQHVVSAQVNVDNFVFSAQGVSLNMDVKVIVLGKLVGSGRTEICEDYLYPDEPIKSITAEAAEAASAATNAASAAASEASDTTAYDEFAEWK